MMLLSSDMLVKVKRMEFAAKEKAKQSSGKKSD